MYQWEIEVSVKTNNGIFGIKWSKPVVFWFCCESRDQAFELASANVETGQGDEKYPRVISAYPINRPAQAA